MLIHQHVPMSKPQQQGRRHENLPRVVRNAILRKRKLWRRWKRIRSAECKHAFNEESRKCSRVIRDYRAQQEADLLFASPHQFFNYVSHRLTPRNETISLRSGGLMLSSAQDIVDCFATEFSKNFSSPRMGSVNADNMHFIAREGPNINIDVSSVRNILMRQSNSAAGPDGIPGVFYRKLAHVLAIPLSTVFQQSIYQQRIPDMWRLAIVSPLYKGKGDRSAASSYRPISLTDVACKLLERLVATQITSFLAEHDLMSNKQHGFRDRRSTISNLITFDALIADYLNRKEPCDVFLLDFARAFDKVPHKTLLNKLRKLGIVGCPLAWIEDFLRDRKQIVRYQGAMSASTDVTSGVVQGSSIGPMIFSAFINDMPSCVHTLDMVLFADDTKAIGKATEPELIQADLDNIGHWSEDNDLPLNIDKSACQHYGHNNARHQYSINGDAIKIAEQYSDLGVLRSDDFCYKKHISAICLKASRLSAMIRRAFCTRDKTFLMRLFTVFVRPMLEYASPLWNPQDVGMCEQLEKVQRRYTQYLFGRHRPSYDDRLQLLHVPRLSVRRRMLEMTLVYKILHGQVNINPADVGLAVSTLSTRSQGIDISVARARTEYVKKAFNYRVASQWNKLPRVIKCSRSLSTFKDSLFYYLSQTEVGE